MKITVKQLRSIIKEEIENATIQRKNLSESYTRITEKEMSEWKKGNWGYVSEAGDVNGEDMSEDYKQCGVCNYDHDYDFPALSMEEMEAVKQLHLDAGFEIRPYRPSR